MDSILLSSLVSGGIKTEARKTALLTQDTLMLMRLSTKEKNVAPLSIHTIFCKKKIVTNSQSLFLGLLLPITFFNPHIFCGKFLQLKIELF